MADYIVTSGELTTVADAIRTKGGTNLPLVFPNGFVTAVNNISGGGGDFTTAQITVNDSNERGWSMAGAFITNNPEGGIITEIYTDEGVNPYIVLYKGVAYINFPGHGVANVSVSGNAEIRTPVVRVTGDCTITIS